MENKRKTHVKQEQNIKKIELYLKKQTIKIEKNGKFDDNKSK